MGYARTPVRRSGRGGGDLPRWVRLGRGAARVSLLSALVVSGVGQAPGLARTASPTCWTPGVVSHRGYWAGGTENTVRAFEQALAAGSGRVELDVRFTEDHQPVLMHDATVDRTTSGTGRVSGMTLARFRELRTADGQRPPTLAEVLELLRGGAEEALVELKEVPDAEDLRSLEDDYDRSGAHRWASLMSFSTSALEAVRSIPARKGLLSTAAPPLSLAGKLSFVGVRYDNLSEALTREYRDHGMAVYAWTPDDESAWRRLAGYGVDRVITNETSAYLAWAREACQP
ncbi:glycerophosphodiester phosphodiesterase [Streptosporangium canum]|uniref:glycerophosphodiester phosphodiesterase n=1 Tax=Streptosporangium canum TaxID=324952 RepID=UPI0036926FDB